MNLPTDKEIIGWGVTAAAALYVFRHAAKDLIQTLGECLGEAIEQANRLKKKWKGE
jgi:hypothetical protein